MIGFSMTSIDDFLGKKKQMDQKSWGFLMVLDVLCSKPSVSVFLV